MKLILDCDELYPSYTLNDAQTLEKTGQWTLNTEVEVTDEFWLVFQEVEKKYMELQDILHELYNEDN